MTDDEWLTPPEILEALGPFDLDPCAHARSATAEHRVFEDGLAADWFGRVWLNPPYSDVTPWIRRLSMHGTGTALLYAKTDVLAWHHWVWPAATALLFFRGRIRFLKPGSKTHTGKSPSVLVAYGLDDADRLEAARFGGAFVPLLVGLAKVSGLDLSWHQLVLGAVRREGGNVQLSVLYASLEGHPKARASQHWRAKVRQQVQRSTFRRVARGEYSLT